MKIFVDLDNTIAETSRHEMDTTRLMFYNYEIFTESYSKELVRVNNFKEMVQLGNGLILKEEVDLFVNGVYNSEEFWKNIPVTEYSQEVLENFQNVFGKGSVLFATSTFDFGGENKVYDGCLTGKIKWIKKHFPFINTRNVIYCGYKWLLKGDYLIEDNAHQLEGFFGKKILIDYPYNRDGQSYGNIPKSVIRVNDWKEIENLILSNENIKRNT